MGTARVISGALRSAPASPQLFGVAFWVCFHLLSPKSNISALESIPPASLSSELESSGLQLDLRWASKWNIYVLSFALPSSWKYFHFMLQPNHCQKPASISAPSLPLWLQMPCSFQEIHELLIQNHVPGDWLTGDHSVVANDSPNKFEAQELTWSCLTAAQWLKVKRNRILHQFIIVKCSWSTS